MISFLRHGKLEYGVRKKLEKGRVKLISIHCLRTQLFINLDNHLQIQCHLDTFLSKTTG
jgi:hypothetical protein